MNRLLFAVALLLASLLCTVKAAAEAPRFPVDHNRIAIGAKETTPDELNQMKAAASKFVLVDVHPRTQFEKESIAGAINIPLEEIDEGLKGIPRDTVLVFVCLQGLRSSQAAKIAEAAGFPHSTFGSITRWKDEGNETAPGKDAL